MNSSKPTNHLKDSVLAELIAAISLNEKSLPRALTRVALCELQERRKTEANSKPVAYTDEDELRFPHATSDMWPQPLGHGKDIPLYRQAQAMPAWVLPVIFPRSVFDVIYQQCGGFVDCEADPQAIWKACRDFMLKGGAA